MLLTEVFKFVPNTIEFSNLFENAQMGREYNHLENLLIFQGSQGGLLALSEIKAICRNPRTLNMKWDGMAAIFWGRDSDGTFYLAPLAQWNRGLKLDREELAKHIAATGKPRAGQSAAEHQTVRQQMSARYQMLWDLLEAATPRDFRGFLNGDLMFDQVQTPKADGSYEFTANKVTYHVTPQGLFGKMPSAQAFIAVHGRIPEFGQSATQGLQSVPDDQILAFNRLPQLIILPTQHPQTGIRDLDTHIDSIMQFVRNHATDIDKVVNYTTPSFTKMRDVLYSYTNRLARSEVDFDTWLLSSNFTRSQKQHVQDLIDSEPQAWALFWKVFKVIQQIKNTVWQAVEKLNAARMSQQYGITAEVNGKLGGEGFVKRMSNGHMGKLVNPNFRSAADNPRYAKKLTESQNTKGVVWIFSRMNPPHWGYSAVINTLIEQAKARNYDWMIFLSSKQEPKKNPLSHAEKIHWLKQLFPQVEGHIVEDPEIKTMLQAASWLYNQGYRSAVFVAGEDDIKSYSRVIRDGNRHGQQNPHLLSQGRAFVFKPLHFVQSERLATATAARKAAAQGNQNEFVKAILGPYVNDTDPKLTAAITNDLYDAVRHGLALSSKRGKHK